MKPKADKQVYKGTLIIQGINKVYDLCLNIANHNET